MTKTAKITDGVGVNKKKSQMSKTKLVKKVKTDNYSNLPVNNSVSTKHSQSGSPINKLKSIFSFILRNTAFAVSIIAIIISLWSNKLVKEGNRIANDANELAQESNLLVQEANLLVQESNKYFEKQTNPNLEIAQFYTRTQQPSRFPVLHLPGTQEAECSVFMRVINSGGATETITHSTHGIINYRNSELDTFVEQSFGDMEFFQEFKPSMTFTVSRTISDAEAVGEENYLTTPFQVKPQDAIDVNATLKFTYDEPPHLVSVVTRYYDTPPDADIYKASNGFYPLTISLSLETLSGKSVQSPPIYCISLK